MSRDPLSVIAEICQLQPEDALEQIACALGYTQDKEPRFAAVATRRKRSGGPKKVTVHVPHESPLWDMPEGQTVRLFLIPAGVGGGNSPSTEASARKRLDAVPDRLRGLVQLQGHDEHPEPASKDGVEGAPATGWPPCMLQDDPGCTPVKGNSAPSLSKWLASKPDARLHAREAADTARGVDACEAPSIPATMFHDAGAIAQCFYCRRYTLDPKALSDRQPTCECGKKEGWSGSFKPPGPDAKWSGKAPAGVKAGPKGDPDEAFRQFQRDRIAEANRYDAEQAKPKLTAPKDGVKACPECGRGEVINGKCDRCGAVPPAPARPLAVLKEAERAAGVAVPLESRNG